VNVLASGVTAVWLAALVMGAAGVFQPQSLGSRDTLAAANLSGKEMRQIVASLEESAYDSPDSWSEELRAKRIDLGGGSGLLLQGTQRLCGGTGNCQLFIFRKVNDAWVSLVARGLTLLAESFQFGPGVTDGIKDLTVWTNTGAQADRRTTYKFDGRFYRASEAMGVDVIQEPGGTMTDDELTRQIAARVSAMWDAYLSQDVVRHNAFLADDYLAVFPDGTARAGKPTPQDIAAALMTRYTLSNLHAELLAPGVALVTYVGEVEGPSGGQIIRAKYSVGNVWVLRNGNWVNRYYQGTPAAVSD